MKLNPLKRLVDQDYADSPPWFMQFVRVINSFFQDVSAVLQGQLTFQDNFACQVVDLDFAGGSTPKLATTLRTPVRGVVVLSVTGSGVTGAPFVVWRQDADGVLIQQVTGLTSGNAYKLRLLLI
jgi:hypothetical protein